MPKLELDIQQGVPALVEGTTADLSSYPDWVNVLRSNAYLPEQVILADPLSYCAGVVRANIAAELLLDETPSGETIYFYHAPIHNDTKLKEWEARGAQVVNSLDEVPDGSVILFSAHGVSPFIWMQAKAKHLRGIDATCPLVDKTHREVKSLKDQKYKILLVGYKNHDEIVGTFGEAPEDITVVSPRATQEQLVVLLEELKDEPKLALRSQTTLAMRDLMQMIEFIQSIRPDLDLSKVSDICFATDDRQEAILASIQNAGAELLIIFGSDETKRQPSSNSIRLREVAEGADAKAYLVEDITEIKPEWFEGISRVGVSAGASAEPKRVAEFIMCLRDLGLTPDRLIRVKVADESKITFANAHRFDFSQ